MSSEKTGSDGECENRARQSHVEQNNETLKASANRLPVYNAIDIVDLIDSLFPDTENISLDTVFVAKSQLCRKRQLLLSSAEQIGSEAEKLKTQYTGILEESRKKCTDVCLAVKTRPYLDDNDMKKMNDALALTSIDSHRAIYFITLWLVKRLDQKLEKMFGQTALSKPTANQNNGTVLWDDRLALGAYSELLDIASSVQSSACKNLVDSITKATEYWFNQLREKFAGEMSKKLTSIHYPFSTAMHPVPKHYTKSPLPQELSSLIKDVRLLLELTPPSTWKPPINDNGTTSTFAITATKVRDADARFGQLLITELTEPLCRRFRFHFYGKRPTNSPDHPEWYHTQILSWLESNSQFVRALFADASVTTTPGSDFDNGIVDELYGSWANVVASLAVEKLSLDIPALLDSDTIFAHLVDETISFRQSLFMLLAKYNAKNVSVDPLRLITSPAVFDRWLDVEKKFALARIDAFLSKSDALTISEKVMADSPVGKDIAMAPTCVIEFVSLVSGLLDRCDIIMSTMYNEDQAAPPFCQFLAMILSLVDGFRIRLLQLGRSSDALSSRGLALLAAAGHLEDALAIDWIHRPVVVACHALYMTSPISSPEAERKSSRESVFPSSQAKRMLEQISVSQTLSSSSPFDFTDEAALFARAVRELADDVVGALEMELTKACVSAAEDHAKGNPGVELPEEQSSHVVITVAHCAAIALHNLLDRLRLGLGGSSALRRLVGSRLAARVDAVLFSQIFERLANRRTVLAQVIAKELNEFLRTRVVYLLARHLTPTAQPNADRLLPRVVDSLHLLTSVAEPVARLLRSTLTAGVSQAESIGSLEEVGCPTFAKQQDGIRLALLVLNIRFGAAV